MTALLDVNILVALFDPMHVHHEAAHEWFGRNRGEHVFWQDSVSMCDGGLFQPGYIQGHRQLTDVYLLGLAVAHRGRLVTFDRGVPLKAVAGAGPEHLQIALI